MQNSFRQPNVVPSRISADGVRRISNPEPPRAKKLSLILLSTLLIAATATAGYFYYQYRHSPEQKAAGEIQDLTSTLGKFMVLPEGEEPTLATVTDKAKLTGQSFFQNAENGDKVLVYSRAGRAILYRPSVGKIIDVASIDVTTPPATKPTTAVPPNKVEPVSETPQTIPVAIFNGSTTNGVMMAMEVTLQEAFPNLRVTQKENAARDDYQGNIVIDLTGRNAALVQEIALRIQGTVGSLPQGETRPAGVDILVIVGNAP